MTRPNKPASEYAEGDDAARRFETTMQQLLRVSKEELQRRESAEKKTQPDDTPPQK